MLCCTRAARQKRFVPTNIVELSMLYRMVLESLESVQEKPFLPLFRKVFLSVREKCILLNGYHGANGGLLVMER